MVAAVWFAGCGGSAPEQQYVRPVKAATVHAVDYVDKDFAGMATADEATNLAFKISGQVSSVDVAKGQYVARGALLSQLDPRDVQLQVDADRALYEKAAAQFERMKRLLEHEAVSRQEYEAAQTSYVQAKSAYVNTKDLLVETKLRAPFDGVVERTYVDTYERVQAGQTIVRIVSPVSSTVEFTMPERSMSHLADTTTRFFVTFDNYPDRRFEARLDSYAKTSSDASGFPVSLKIAKAEAERVGISPGMTCSVTMRTAERRRECRRGASDGNICSCLGRNIRVAHCRRRRGGTAARGYGRHLRPRHGDCRERVEGWRADRHGGCLPSARGVIV